MDALTNKSYKSYDYISRYASFPYYYNKLDSKYIYGITANVDQDISFVAHIVREQDTLDNLALTYYGRPDYYWVIADYNQIQDPYTKLWGKYSTIKIPTLSNVKFKS